MTFVSVGNVLVDVLTRIPALPERGGDVLGVGSGMSPGGAFNAMVSASRQGLPAAYAGGHGVGFFGDLIRNGLRENGIGTLLPATSGKDSGYDIALIDGEGERTFVTAFGAEAELSAEQLASIELKPGDILHVSGYGLLETTNGAVLAPWLESVDPAVTVMLDPGPLVADIRPEVWAKAADRADWVSCNEREAAAIEALGRTATPIVVRLGANGCELREQERVIPVPGFNVAAVDLNGAGDAHVGAFAAALAAGLAPAAAAQRANAAAAIAVGRFGPATAPTLVETLALIASKA